MAPENEKNTNEKTDTETGTGTDGLKKESKNRDYKT